MCLLRPLQISLLGATFWEKEMLMENASVYFRKSPSLNPKKAEEHLQQMNALITQNGWHAFRVYCDTEQLSKPHLPAYEQMLSDAAKHRFDILVFWSLSGLSQQNTAKTVLLLHRLSSWGVRFCSYTEPHLNTCNNLKDTVTSLLATLAQQNSFYISHRTRAGLEDQRQTNKPGSKGYFGPGRPAVVFDEKLALSLRSQKKKMSYQSIAEKCGVSKATIFRFFKSLDAEDPKKK
jgi:DNA invertase Pin-like site-specific DNA recombinase